MSPKTLSYILHDFDALPDNAYVTRQIIRKLLPFSTPTIRRLECKGGFPQHIKVGGQCCYRLGDYRRWAENPEAYVAGK